PVSLVIRRELNQWLLAARFEGRPSGLDAVSSSIGGFLDLSGKVDDADSSDYWQLFMDGRAFSDLDEVRLQIRAMPTESVALAERALEIAERTGAKVSRIEIEPGVGLVTISWAHNEDVSALTIGAIREALPEATVTVLTAPDTVKRAMDVWGEEPEAIDLMRRLKQEFDPNRVLNPGRFAGKI
ncbi:MAG TPA: FAD-linked oxidase C-terminal domain-containing protein, partial [Thermomicrobiales bacterium]|nr:FAD-linked oxidase C-terminal domain-containing protein [Thermomicrobiales bacterium]